MVVEEFVVLETVAATLTRVPGGGSVAPAGTRQKPISPVPPEGTGGTEGSDCSTVNPVGGVTKREKSSAFDSPLRKVA